MSQTTVATVLGWITQPAGTCREEELIEYLNRARGRMYLMYSEIPLFEISECFEVQSFCEDCDTCHERFSGITLPRDFQNVEALWWNDLPANLFSSWREWQVGMSAPCECGLAKYDLPGTYSSERDILPGRAAKLKAVALHSGDVGKDFVIRGRDMFGGHVVKQGKLTLEGTFTDAPMVSLAQGSGFVKEITAGPVVLAEESGRVLSVYAPDETMPGYKRIKITGLRGCDTRVNVRGARKYFPVYRTSDVVETDNRPAFEEMVRYLRLNDKVNKEGTDFQSMAGHLQQAKEALKGEIARDTGKNTEMSMDTPFRGFGPRRIGRR